MQTSVILSTLLTAVLAQSPVTTVTLPSNALIAPSTVVQVATVTSTLPAGSTPTTAAAASVAPVSAIAASPVAVSVNVAINGTVPLPVISRNGTISGVSGIVYSGASTMSAGTFTIAAVALVSSIFTFAL